MKLNPMPRVLASGTQTMFDYQMNVTPPKSYEEWGYLIESFTRHLVERYGSEEVRKWYFETWYNKTGDWKINTALFPESYQQVRKKVEKSGTKLGLWFNPSPEFRSLSFRVCIKKTMETRRTLTNTEII